MFQELEPEFQELEANTWEWAHEFQELEFKFQESEADLRELALLFLVFAFSSAEFDSISLDDALP